MKPMIRPLLVLAFAGIAVLGLVTIAEADHSWANYHWSRTANPFTVALGDNVDSTWDARLAEAASDWNASSVLDTPVVAGGTRPRNCQATAGRVEVCSDAYGNTGWLGVAQIWVSGDHITQGTAKLNDTYHNSAPYNTYSWRQLVMCQEVGHTFGLNHQDEDFNTKTSPGTCMDYTNDPVGSEGPNAHDYEQLETIYAHLDSGGGSCKGGPKKCGASAGSNGAPPAFDMTLPDLAQWGRMVSLTRDGGQSVFVQDFGDGFRVVTHVTWTMEAAQYLAAHRDELLGSGGRLRK